MTPDEFENLLDHAVDILTENLRSSSLYHGPNEFQQHVLDMLRVAARGSSIEIAPTFHPHAFPDIVANGFGIEVKYTKQDTWTAVGNSIFEGMRDRTVDSVYVVFGKVGGYPEARWRRYSDCVTHVRVSHAPRFVIEMEGERESLFGHMGIKYDDFAKLDDDGKMRYVRDYSRNRLEAGERLWWIEPEHSVPIQVRPYMTLTQPEKRMLRAEAAILCPRVCSGSRVRNKYTDAALYLLNQHGVLCTQARDLFSAGSVALRADDTRGGIYIMRALQDIEDLMLDAAKRLDGALFEEYWGRDYPPAQRIPEWLRRADEYATDWTPSENLFTGARDG